MVSLSALNQRSSRLFLRLSPPSFIHHYAAVGPASLSLRGSAHWRAERQNIIRCCWCVCVCACVIFCLLSLCGAAIDAPSSQICFCVGIHFDHNLKLYHVSLPVPAFIYFHFNLIFLYHIICLCALFQLLFSWLGWNSPPGLQLFQISFLFLFQKC